MPILLTIVLSLIIATPAVADFEPIDDRSSFVEIVQDKKLKIPFVQLEVLLSGEVTGSGLGQPVNGTWTWKDRYFCRTLVWGRSELAYDCQTVYATSNHIRFSADRGRGDSVTFRIR
ncbi:MAG: dihydrodipicolinate reductase [Aestuariivita sp.]|nr:dihydrodipicolinate reductase [Aestuariivita sp.]MCY4201056.1 dihydrodipicolinate reductase [Aestuariivita sp.]MCY4288878.1 dihydrodipicolinate reductase [Aestuariivita sp.]MCY4345232.1 dihydrodipicolinate reductase [Aestuariivita sp.]